MPVFEKCQTQKFALREQRQGTMTTGRRRKRVTEYGKQLIEKQKVRYIYGISERALKGYVKKAEKQEGATTVVALGEFLERRLDNMVYRLGLADTRRMARQMVSHGHFTVNDRKSTIPSYQVRNTDIVGIREGSKQTTLFKKITSDGITSRAPWLNWDTKKKTGSINKNPTTDDDFFGLPTVLEYYSR